MHSDWFNGIEILQGRWKHGEKVGYCYPSGLEKTLCKWDIYVCPAGHERVNEHMLVFGYGFKPITARKLRFQSHHSPKATASVPL
jgi:hypothetical protein